MFRSEEKYKDAMNMYIKDDVSIIKVCKIFKISRSRFSKYLRNNNVVIDRRLQKNDVDNSVFENIDTEEKAYWLGFMYADGYVISNSNTIGLGLAELDVDHLEKFKSFIKYKGNIRRRERYKSVSIEFRDFKMKDDLIKKGCIPNKSLILKFPNEDILPPSLHRHFIRGYFDGDGCICNTERTLCVDLIGTYDFLEKVCDISNISKDRIYKLNKNSKNFRIVLGGKNDILNFINYIYKNSNIFLERKHNKYIEVINAH